jgi:hypothetical protein
MLRQIFDTKSFRTAALSVWLCSGELKGTSQGYENWSRNGRSNPADIGMYQEIGGKHACVGFRRAT